ncbi:MULTISPECIES: T9SS type A sorting domain-containing protein [Chryseobacterium]|uniref:T9SS type A sorting domain-containing protein n=1 Tax=Chryseobacterium TaxID=59732 RepID=UPI000E250B39
MKEEKVNKTSIKLDISNYQSGTYFIKIITYNGNTFRKFIKLMNRFNTGLRMRF